MRGVLAKQNAARRELARIEKGKRDGEKFVNTSTFRGSPVKEECGALMENIDSYHIYVDRELFPYQIELTRDDAEAGEFGQKYTLCVSIPPFSPITCPLIFTSTHSLTPLQLWESNAKPHLYWFTAKFIKARGSSQPKYHRPSAHAGKWRPEMDLFADFFRIKTGVAWEDRVVRMKTMPACYFQYSPPVSPLCHVSFVCGLERKGESEG